jgi:hypothetical protein
MSFHTVLIAGSDPERVSAIRARIPNSGYVVHTVFADPTRLERLLHGIGFDVILIDRGSRDSDALQAIIDQAACRHPAGEGCEVLGYPFEQDALMAALSRANRRQQRRFYVFPIDSALH